jgi:hypothetical protein
LFIEDSLKVQFHIYYLPSGVFASHERDWWIGPNASVQWEPQSGYAGTKAYTFSKEDARKIGSSGIQLWAWVKYTNGSVLRTEESIWCYFLTSQGEEPPVPDEWSLEDLVLFIVIVLIFGVPSVVLLVVLYKMKKGIETHGR